MNFKHLFSTLFLIFLTVFSLLSHAKIIEETTATPVKVKDLYGKEYAHQLHTWIVYDDAVQSPRPVAILGHGRSSKPEQRANLDIRSGFLNTARWLARQGFLVVGFTRIGYGPTGGEDIDNNGKCSQPIFPAIYETSAQQMLQVLQAARTRPDAQKDRAIIIGQSFGGATAIAVAAKNPTGVQAILNFAGGGGGRPDTHPANPCGEHIMRGMLADFGKTARIPTFWGYTENDLYWGPQYPKDWFDGFKSNGGKGEYVLFPANGADGHALFYRAPDVWRPKATEFLRTNGFPEVKTP